MRLAVALAAALFLVPAVPAGAHPATDAQQDRALAEAARWVQQINAASDVATEALSELDQRMKAVPRDPSRAKAALPALREILARERRNIARANAMLDALPPYSAHIDIGIPPQRIIEDARQLNAHLLEVTTTFDAFALALERGDLAGQQRMLPRVGEGALALVAGQRLALRNRQLMVSPDSPERESIGVGVELYRLVETVMRAWIAARDPAAAARAAATLREQSGALARDVRATAATGRSKLRRDLAIVDAGRAVRGLDPERKKHLDRDRESMAMDEGTYAIADRAAAMADGFGRLTAAQLQQSRGSDLLRPLILLNDEYESLAQKELARVADEGAAP